MTVLNTIFTDQQLIEEIKKTSRLKVAEKDAVLMLPGDPLVFIPIVQSGVFRVLREDSEGQEIFLYHIYPGETCAMAINCCQTGRISMIKAVAEETTEVLLVPVNKIEDLFKYPEWKAFINRTYSQRFSELIKVIDLITFSNMDKLILNYLKKRAEATRSKIIPIVHQQIADELHTHREVVSRLLRTMERKNIVKLGRNSIELL